MLREFYNYLARRTYSFFNSTTLSIGDKFILNLDDRDDIDYFYTAFEKLLDSQSKKLPYVRASEEFKTYQFEAENNSDVHVVVVKETSGSSAYMTNLRNRLSDEGVLFMISCNPIDSINAGTESLKKEGMPFHKDKFTHDIKTEIRTSGLTDGERAILSYALEDSSESDIMDMYSLKDFVNIIEILSKGKIEADDFYTFGLFSDQEITAPNLFEKKVLSERVKDNHSKFKKIDDIVKYGNPKDGLEGMIVEKDITKIIGNISKSVRWDDGLTYAEIKESFGKANKKQEDISIIDIEITADGSKIQQNKDFFVRYEKETTVGKRKPQILIFNSSAASEIIISVELSNFPGSNSSSFTDKSTKDTVKTSGKKIVINIDPRELSINTAAINLNDRSEKYEISYCSVNCGAEWFSDIVSRFSIKGKTDKKSSKSLVILCDENILKLNSGKDKDELVLKQDIGIVAQPDKTCVLTIDENSFDENGITTATIIAEDIKIPVIFKETVPINSSISGVKIEQKLLASQFSFEYRGNNKLVHGTDEYNTREELKNIIELEAEMVRTKAAYGEVDSDENFNSIDLSLNESVRNTYNDFMGYFKTYNTLPSLAYYNDELRELAERYLDAVLNELSAIKEDTSLPNCVRDIMKIGVVMMKSKDIIALSAVHPINVAHKLKLTASSGKNEIREDVLKKLSADNLLPFIHDEKGNLYKVQEQMQAINWIYYSPMGCKKFKGSRNFVVNLVTEKINDFYSHFNYLFDNIGGRKIIINAVNMGDCRNLFIGIINYFKSKVKEESNKALSVIVNVYDDINSYNVFEVLSHKNAFKNILEEIGIKDDDNNFSENEFINLVLSKLKYFRKRKTDEKYEYCHLAFIEMDTEHKTETANKSEISSGTMLDGLMSGVTSMYYGENRSYRTGYGSKFNLPRSNDSRLYTLVEFYNSAMVVYGTESAYNSKLAICTSIAEKETEMINKTYDAANWVVFIDPKVDLNYFKNNDKDVMIIHYSDQHTTSSGYDAITVTRKTEQYENILREFMIQNSIRADNNENVRKMIDMFNAVNGDWLLKLISSKENFRKEKISIQSAIKLALAFFKNDNIIWIPISLEEILRVSGAIGLAQKDGLFSAKNLGYDRGATSDDLLMFGVEMTSGNVFVHLYPLEVKIGYKDNNELVKAKEQIHSTRSIFDNALVNDTNDLQAKFYRNFIAQLAIISAQKLELYKIWDSQDWERVVGSDIRGKLLNDDFTVSDSLRDKIGDGIIISFKSEAIVRSVNNNDNVTVIKFMYSDGIDYITKSVDEIRENIMAMPAVKGHLFDNLSEDIQTRSIAAPEIQIDEKRDHFELEEHTINSLNADFDDISDAIIGLFDEIEESNETEERVETIDEPMSETSKDSALTIEGNNGMKILFGADANSGRPLYWYPNDTEKTMHPNTGIIGTMGSGKTQFTKSLVLQLVREQCNNPGGKSLGILIFDYKGDYNESKQDFIDATGAKVYSVYKLPFNPFAIVNQSKPLMPIYIADAFADNIRRNYNLGPKQVTMLCDCIAQAYEAKGIDCEDSSTWINPAPTFEDVYNIYMDSDSRRDDSLNAAMTKLHKFRVFEPDPQKTVSLYDLIDGVTVIDLQTCEESLQNLIVALTLDLFYSQMRAFGHSKNYGKLRQLTKFILVDEADNFLREGFPSVRKILKEGREFGVGTILSTQFLDHFDTQDDDFAKYILTWIVHKVTDLTSKNLKNLFNTTSKSEEDELITTIQQLNMSYSVVKMGNTSAPLYIQDKPFWKFVEEGTVQSSMS